MATIVEFRSVVGGGAGTNAPTTIPGEILAVQADVEGESDPFHSDTTVILVIAGEDDGLTYAMDGGPEIPLGPGQERWQGIVDPQRYDLSARLYSTVTVTTDA
jgi:hypothetical protein